MWMLSFVINLEGVVHYYVFYGNHSVDIRLFLSFLNCDHRSQCLLVVFPWIDNVAS